MAEQQSVHRQGIETKVIDSNICVQKRGPIYGFIVAMTAIVCGTILVLKGKDGYGLAAILGTLAALAGVFVIGKYEQRKELSNKAQAFIPVPPPDASTPTATPNQLVSKS